MVVDVKRAFLHGLCTRSIYVELPGAESQGGKYVGKLVRSLYGTRDAPLAWLTVVKSDMKELGFKECKVTNGVFTHPGRNLRVVVHVDDFLLSGEGHHLTWFRDQLSKKYEFKVQVAGWEHSDNKELSFLGRVIRLTATGIELEGDDKHVGMLEKEWGMECCNPVATPFVKVGTSTRGPLTTQERTTACTPAASRSNQHPGGRTPAPPEEDEAKEMGPADATLYRRAAARINYVALDRPDLSFASRVASSRMSCAREGDDLVIKRIIRYLKGKPRVAIKYKFQEASEGVTVFTDSDWAGDKVTRKSTSGGVVCRGQHTISWWCKLQSNIALSSCEAELNAALKGAVEGLNVQRLAASLGDYLPLELRTDASAARGVILRQGVGKVRHLQVKQLWLQENVAAGELTIVKIPRAQNCSDALTHPWSANDLPFWAAMGISFIPRGQAGPEEP